MCLIITAASVEAAEPAGFLVGSSAMVPMRPVFEWLRATVQYSNGTVSATRGDKVVKLRVGAKQATVNERNIKLSSAATVRDGTVYVPLRFVAESMGALVSYDARTRRATLVADERSLVVSIAVPDPVREAGEVFRAFLRYREPGQYSGRRIGLLNMQRHSWLDADYGDLFRYAGVDREELLQVEQDRRFAEALSDGGGAPGHPWWVFEPQSDGSVWFATADCGFTVRVRRGPSGPTAAEVRADTGPAVDQPAIVWKAVPRNGGWAFARRGQ